MVIDVSQSVDLDHPQALQFLREDALHINTFFGRWCSQPSVPSHKGRMLAGSWHHLCCQQPLHACAVRMHSPGERHQLLMIPPLSSLIGVITECHVRQ